LCNEKKNQKILICVILKPKRESKRRMDETKVQEMKGCLFDLSMLIMMRDDKAMMGLRMTNCNVPCFIVLRNFPRSGIGGRRLKSSDDMTHTREQRVCARGTREARDGE
jgi:hypothetical protein